MERRSKITPEYMDDLLNRVHYQIERSKNIIANSKEARARSKEQTQQHATEIESNIDTIKIKK